MGGNTADGLAQLLEELSWVKVPCPVTPSLRLSVGLRSNGLRAPPWARELFRADGFSALVSGDDFYLTDGSSLLYLQPGQGQGTASIAPSFFTKHPLLQSNFWAFGLLKLLRPLGLYSLHAAAVVAKQGLGLLIVGPSGSGKSTLAIGLIRHGWRYLSDDAVLLRSQAEKVEALALRKHFYIDADAGAVLCRASSRRGGPRYFWEAKETSSSRRCLSWAACRTMSPGRVALFPHRSTGAKQLASHRSNRRPPALASRKWPATV